MHHVLNVDLLGLGESKYLFVFQIPEYCKAMDEQDIVNNSFNLIFAFDEIVALGYRENVNLAQIRTFVEMDSHEEKVYQAVRQVFLIKYIIMHCHLTQILA